jgi:two-component system, cell cycle response regulator
MITVPQIDQHLVDVIGFNGTERSMLSSIFALAARRDPGFVQYDPVSKTAPHLYLVDADDQAALTEFRALNRHASLPAVLVGSCQPAEGVVVVERPIQWARLIQAMEDALGTADETMPAPLESLPRQPDSLENSGSWAIRTSPPGSNLASAGKKIESGDVVLVVDDNATVRTFMQAKLAPFKFEVDFAESGEQAVGLTGAREYACIFLDVVLPGIDGYHVCKLIKSNKQAMKKTAVVMLTSRSSPFDKLRGSLAGCDEYLTKPLDEDRLLEVIAKFLPGAAKRARSKHR